MTKYIKPGPKYPDDWNYIRSNIFAEYNYRCAKCQKYAKGDLHLHHIIPLNEGGGNHKGNLIPLCSSCHRNVHWYKERI